MGRFQDAVASPTPRKPGLHSDTVTVTERLGTLIDRHQELLRRLRGPQPEAAEPGNKVPSQPESLSDFVSIMLQQLLHLEEQTADLFGVIG